MSYAAKIVKGSSIIFLMHIVSGVIAYFLRLFIARNLTVYEFGLLYAVLSFVGFLTIFRDLGFGQTLTKFVAEFNAKKDFSSIKSSIMTVIAFEVAAGIIIAALVFVFSDVISLYYFKTDASFALKIIVTSFAVSGFVSLQFVFQGLGKIKYYAAVEPIRNIATAIAVIVLISMGVVGVAYAYLFAAIVISIIIFFLMIKIFPFFSVKSKTNKKFVKKFVLFSATVFFTGIAGTILGYMDTLMITYFLSLTDVGFYNAALPTSQLLWVLGGSISVALFPIITELWTRKDTVTLSRIIGLLIKFSFIIVIPIVLLIVAFPEMVIKILFGEQFLPAAQSLQVLVLASLFYTAFAIASNALVAIGRPAVNIKVVSIMSIANLILNVILIPIYGIVGAAFATTFSYFVGCGISIFYLRRSVSFLIYASDVIKSFVSGIASFVLVIYLKSIIFPNSLAGLTIVSVIGIVVYMCMIYFMNVIKKDEMKLLSESGLPIPKFVVKLFKK